MTKSPYPSDSRSQIVVLDPVMTDAWRKRASLIEASLQEAHLVQPERVPQSSRVQAERPTHQMGPWSLMDVTAHQKACVARREGGATPLGRMRPARP